MHRINSPLLLLVGAGLVLSACKPQVPPVDAEMLYQVSTIYSLFSGSYDGLQSIGWLKEHGDLGIGTFDHLNGEMIVLDGQVYQALADGSMAQPDDSERVPFANVTRFEADRSFTLDRVENVAALQEVLVANFPRKDRFYAVRIDAHFRQVQARTVPYQNKPYPPLAEVLKFPVILEFEGLDGTVVGFWSPEYVGEVNLPGFNLHFISADRKVGGHLVEGVMENVRISLDETYGLSFTLDPSGN